MPNLDPLVAPVEPPLIVPVLPPLIVPVLPPLIVPVLPPEMVPTAVERPPEIVPAEAMGVSDKVNTVANEICLRFFILFLRRMLICLGHAGGLGLSKLHPIPLENILVRSSQFQDLCHDNPSVVKSRNPLFERFEQTKSISTFFSRHCVETRQ